MRSCRGRGEGGGRWGGGSGGGTWSEGALGRGSGAAGRRRRGRRRAGRKGSAAAPSTHLQRGGGGGGDLGGQDELVKQLGVVALEARHLQQPAARRRGAGRQRSAREKQRCPSPSSDAGSKQAGSVRVGATVRGRLARSVRFLAPRRRQGVVWRRSRPASVRVMHSPAAHLHAARVNRKRGGLENEGGHAERVGSGWAASRAVLRPWGLLGGRLGSGGGRGGAGSGGERGCGGVCAGE